METYKIVNSRTGEPVNFVTLPDGTQTEIGEGVSVVAVLTALVEGYRATPTKTREQSLTQTKLEEALFWATR